MSANRVACLPARLRKSSRKTDERNALLELMVGKLVDTPSCTFCRDQGFSCRSAEADSSRCYECVRYNQSYCDCNNKPLTPQQLRRIGAQHQKVDSELEAAEEELAELNRRVELEREKADAKVRRLRKQKKLWFEKMMRAISRGIDNVEELERVEREEAEQAQKSSGVLPTPSEELDPALVRSFEADFDFSSVDFSSIDFSFPGNETGQAASNSS